MKGGSPESKPPVANIDEDETSTNREAIAVPMFAGLCRFRAMWISEPINQFTKEAPAEMPGKK